VSAPEHEVFYIGPDGVPIGVVRPSPPPPQRVWLHALLLGATFVSTTLVGGLAFGDLPEGFRATSIWQLLLQPFVIHTGLAFSVPLLFILLTHEMGHYIACRAHRLDASLPYFIPAPVGIGTFGAFIRIRTAIASKRELLDVGAAGPLAGFVACLPLVFLGIALSHPVAEMPAGGFIVFGEPIAFHLVTKLFFPHLPPNGDILLHPTGFAAWFGLFATALNLLPFGQLDGGHITYALFGKLQRRYAWPLLLVLIALGFKWTGWFLWVVVALAMGVRHPRVGDEETPLDPRRRWIAWACIVVFALCFTPQPIKIVP
jgi:membrane-associated protease RseP (regulator of RpoE activity)